MSRSMDRCRWMCSRSACSHGLELPIYSESRIACRLLQIDVFFRILLFGDLTASEAFAAVANASRSLRSTVNLFSCACSEPCFFARWASLEFDNRGSAPHHGQ